MTTRIKKDGAFYAKTGPKESKQPRTQTNFRIDNNKIDALAKLLAQRKSVFSKTSTQDLLNEGLELLLVKNNIPFSGESYFSGRSGVEL